MFNRSRYDLIISGTIENDTASTHTNIQDVIAKKRRRLHMAVVEVLVFSSLSAICFIQASGHWLALRYENFPTFATADFFAAIGLVLALFCCESIVKAASLRSIINCLQSTPPITPPAPERSDR